MGRGCIPGICINTSDADLADKARSVQSGEFEVFQQEDHDGFERADTGTTRSSRLKASLVIQIRRKMRIALR